MESCEKKNYNKKKEQGSLLDSKLKTNLHIRFNARIQSNENAGEVRLLKPPRFLTGKKDSLFRFMKDFVSLLRTLDSFILCCYAKKAIDDLFCESPLNEFSSCEDMMKNPAVRVCLWILGIIALFGNLSVIFWRLVHSEDSRVQSFLLRNLAFSDFLMGVYLIILAVQDTRWQGEYFKYDVQWRAGTLCQVTGALSMLSSEVSW